MWQYRQVVYVPNNRAWQSDLGDRGGVMSDQFWIAEICSAPQQQGWKLLTILPEGTNRFHFVFRKPLHEVTTRLPGRVDRAATAFASANDLASALRRAEAAHGEHEKRTGQSDPNWPDWYAAYMVAEQAGEALPQ